MIITRLITKGLGSVSEYEGATFIHYPTILLLGFGSFTLNRKLKTATQIKHTLEVKSA